MVEDTEKPEGSRITEKYISSAGDQDLMDLTGGLRVNPLKYNSVRFGHSRSRRKYRSLQREESR